MTELALNALSLSIAMLMGLVFLAAAVGKMRSWPEFHGVVANYRLLPEWLIVPVAYALPPVESALGLALLLHLQAPLPQLLAIGLLLIFAAAMAINLRRGRRDIDCGCFQSTLRQRLSGTLVVRNLVMAAFLGMTVSPQSEPTDSAVRVSALLAGGILFVLLHSLNILWGIVPSWRRAPRLYGGARS